MRLRNLKLLCRRRVYVKQLMCPDVTSLSYAIFVFYYSSYIILSINTALHYTVWPLELLSSIYQNFHRTCSYLYTVQHIPTERSQHLLRQISLSLNCLHDETPAAVSRHSSTVPFSRILFCLYTGSLYSVHECAKNKRTPNNSCHKE